MTFEEWKRIYIIIPDSTGIGGMLADWKTERESQQKRINELKDSNKTLVELALDWLQSSKAARRNIFGTGDRVDYETAKKEISALQGEER